MKIIKLKIKGYLKSLSNKEIITINTNGIKNNNKISYIQDDTSHKLVLEKDKIILIRENKEFKSIIEFVKDIENQSYYFLKENNMEIKINIKTTKLEITANEIKINYIIIDSNELYEYKIEMR